MLSIGAPPQAQSVLRLHELALPPRRPLGRCRRQEHGRNRKRDYDYLPPPRYVRSQDSRREIDEKVSVLRLQIIVPNRSIIRAVTGPAS